MPVSVMVIVPGLVIAVSVLQLVAVSQMMLNIQRLWRGIKRARQVISGGVAGSHKSRRGRLGRVPPRRSIGTTRRFRVSWFGIWDILDFDMQLKTLMSLLMIFQYLCGKKTIWSG